MSQKKTKLLFPTDFSEYSLNAFGLAKYLASVYEAEFYILHVIEAPSKIFSGFDMDAAKKKTNEMLEAFINKHDDDDRIIFNKMVKVGKPFRKVVEAADEIGANAIIMGTHGLSGVREVFAGSNASRVIRTAPCPVFTIREKPDHFAFRKILLPLDLTRETGEKIRFGVEFAEIFGSELVLMSVLNSEDQEVHKRLKGRLEKAVDHCRQRGVSVSSSMVVSKDNVGDVVMKYGEEINADLVCIMTQQEKNFKETVLGTNAAHIVNNSNIPVMAIKPVKEYHESNIAGAHFG